MNSDSLRSRKEYQLTKLGRKSLLIWLHAPVDPVEVRRRPRLPLLRFSFLDQFTESEHVIEFLRQYKEELLAYRDELQLYIKFTLKKLSQTGVLAIELAIEELNTRIRWAGRILDSRSDTRSSQKKPLVMAGAASASSTPVSRKEKK